MRYKYSSGAAPNDPASLELDRLDDLLDLLAQDRVRAGGGLAVDPEEPAIQLHDPHPHDLTE